MKFDILKSLAFLSFEPSINQSCPVVAFQDISHVNKAQCSIVAPASKNEKSFQNSFGKLELERNSKYSFLTQAYFLPLFSPRLWSQCQIVFSKFVIKTYSNVRSVINLMTLLYAPLEPTNPFLGHHYHHHHHQGVPHFRKNPNNCLFFVLFIKIIHIKLAGFSWLAHFRQYFFMFFLYLLSRSSSSRCSPVGLVHIRQSGRQPALQGAGSERILPYCRTATLPHFILHTSTVFTSANTFEIHTSS